MRYVWRSAETPLKYDTPAENSKRLTLVRAGSNLDKKAKGRKGAGSLFGHSGSVNDSRPFCLLNTKVSKGRNSTTVTLRIPIRRRYYREHAWIHRRAFAW